MPSNGNCGESKWKLLRNRECLFLFNFSCFNWIQWRKQQQQQKTHTAAPLNAYKRQSHCNIGNVVVVVVVWVSLDQAPSKFTDRSGTNENFSIYFSYTLRFSRSSHVSLFVSDSLAWFNVFDDKTKIKTLLFVYKYYEIVHNSAALFTCIHQSRTTTFNAKTTEVWMCPVNL